MKVRLFVAPITLFFLVACADAPLDPDDGRGIDHGIASDDLLVGISLEGGFVSVEWTYTNIPLFSLYGDGTLVLPGPQMELYPGPALPAISRRQVDEAGIQAILEEAVDMTKDIPAGLDDLGFAAIADASTTVITVSAGGVDRTIRAYALGELTERPDGMPEPQYEARVRLQDLIARMTGLDSWMPEGSVGPEGAYEASAARVFVGPYREVDDLVQTRVPWPLSAGLGDFGDPDPSSEFRCGVVQGSDWDVLRDAASTANELTPWTSEGSRYSILFQPLLPDETGC